ncbi:hypothetical protein AGMMS49949_09030 [Alphaproteobacteria bacterium]|nr:hypothetical protein AGMMS49949_09030 [Alphaproteobacteria bacterium]
MIKGLRFSAKRKLEMLKYDKIMKKPVTFQRLFGVNLKDFEKILKKLKKFG